MPSGKDVFAAPGGAANRLSVWKQLTFLAVGLAVAFVVPLIRRPALVSRPLPDTGSNSLPSSQAAPTAGATVELAASRRASWRRFAVAGVSLSSVAFLIALEVVATFNHYAMRVISDTPTFIALIRDLGAHPMHPTSVFFAGGHTSSVHASPYLQALALLWRVIAPASHQNDAMAIGTFLAVVGIPVTLTVLGVLWLYVRSLAGTTAAFFSLPVLLTLFGPAHVVFSSDLTINGFLATGYYPTTLATGLTLAGLMTITRRGWRMSCLSALLVALTVTTDLFSGAVLVIVLVLYAVVACHHTRAEAWRIPAILTAGFALAQCWPLFSVWGSFSASKLPVPALLVMALVAPQLSLRLGPRLGRLIPSARTLTRRPIGGRAEQRIANLGRWLFGGLVLWSLSQLSSWSSNPVVHSYRLGMYWDNAVWRWAFLLLPGLIGLVGLVRLARRGRGELLLWLGSMYLIGAIGSVVFLATGRQLPLYYRFFLACQIPLAVGVAAFLAHHKSRRAFYVTLQVLILAFAFKALTLLTEPTNINYFGSQMPSAWHFGAIIPRGSGIVATDPSTSYYIPATTGNKVLTLSGHADSGQEPHVADAGYLDMHRLYTGDTSQFAQTMASMYERGVRWVVVEKFTSLKPATRELLFATPTSGLIGAADVRLMSAYMSRLELVGTQTYADNEYTVFHLDGSRLRRALASRALVTAEARPQVVATLRLLAYSHGAQAKSAARRLYELGVRQVTITAGAFGAQPEALASGDALAAGDEISTTISARGLTCNTICTGYRGLAWTYSLGGVIYRDSRFSTIVRLRAPVKVGAAR